MLEMSKCTHVHVVKFSSRQLHLMKFMPEICCVANLRSRNDALVPELAELALVEPHHGQHRKWLEPSYSRVEVDCMIQYASPIFKFLSDVVNSKVFSTL